MTTLTVIGSFTEHGVLANLCTVYITFWITMTEFNVFFLSIYISLLIDMTCFIWYRNMYVRIRTGCVMENLHDSALTVSYID